jgi:hypothetical protein
MPSVIMDALVIRGHPWSSMELGRLASRPGPFSTSAWYISAAGVIRREGLMKRGPIVASIALMALAAQRVAQQ